MNEMTWYAIDAVDKVQAAFCKFIYANDVGATGAHQDGIYIPKNCWSLIFDNPSEKGVNKDHFVKIRWKNNFETDNRFIYYGKGTRNEYRLTRFGKRFPFFQEDNVGDLIIICRTELDYYFGFVLSADEDIDNFFGYFQYFT
ncbi:EcoRII N-terminal effector-binding domain-containing protein [Odoribacter laneus]|uniref:EcoRII N-terminal effector-binding domain-containing protein n=1 Tax=Odoribacter laneus TaxID=626933 RepID=UPI00033EA865|nr:EcoRII N-terminal effector-binding domain-containing protein [Odoribacter laneus]CCZ80418.1 ecoRII C-terminal domain protein [Odoribacter laneus CAG:561]